MFFKIFKRFYLFYFLNNIFKDFVYLFFRERGKEGEREGEKHQCVVASHAPPTGDLAHNPGMCPDWESNRRPFGVQASTQSTEPPQLGLSLFCIIIIIIFLNFRCQSKFFYFFRRIFYLINSLYFFLLLCFVSPYNFPFCSSSFYAFFSIAS